MFGIDVELIVAGAGVLVGLIGAIAAIVLKVRSKEYKIAAVKTGVLLDETIRAVDKIKTVTSGNDREAVKSVLKGFGERLDNLGMKGEMDDKVSSIGLDSKS